MKKKWIAEKREGGLECLFFVLFFSAVGMHGLI